jgi:hypothetical protein
MFFCIGAQKAGTTWLYNALSANPQVHFSKNKELHYFDVIMGRAKLALVNRVRMAQALAAKLEDRTGRRNSHTVKQLRDVTDLLDIYTGSKENHAPYLTYLLRNYRAQPIVCDITPSYAILSRDDFANMAAIGNTRFGFIMRDPVDRMWSQIRMAVSYMGVDDGDFDAACIAHAQSLIDTQHLARIVRANYRQTITELEAAVPQEHIKYMFFEDLFAPETMQDLCAFLHIDPVFADAQTFSNQGRSAPMPDSIRSAIEDAFEPQYRFIRDRFGDAVPASWAKVRPRQLVPYRLCELPQYGPFQQSVQFTNTSTYTAENQHA